MSARWRILAGVTTTLAGTLLLITLFQTPERLQGRSCPPPAEQLSPAMFQSGSNTAQDRGFLWRISKRGHTSYLYGTMHIAKQGWMFPGRTVRAAFDASDLLAVEVDSLDPSIMERVGKSFSAPENNLPLPDPLLDRLRTFAERVCASLSVLDKMFPQQQITAMILYVSRYDGLYLEYGIDDSLKRLARATQKPIVSLENPDLRGTVLRVDDALDSILLGTGGIEALESGRSREVALRFAEVWAESRYDDFLRYKEWCGCFDTDVDRRFYRRLVDDRNRIQALAIDALHEMGHNVFAAIGYVHMVGDGGLPGLLEQMGYQVEFVVFAKRG